MARTTASLPLDLAHAEDIANTIAFKRRLLAQAGGAFDAEAVRKLLGHNSVEAVYKAARESGLLMVEDNSAKFFPAFQFDGNVIRPAIARILAAADGVGGWTILQFLVGGDEMLGADRPIDLIRGNAAALDSVVRAVHMLAD